MEKLWKLFFFLKRLVLFSLDASYTSRTGCSAAYCTLMKITTLTLSKKQRVAENGFRVGK